MKTTSMLKFTIKKIHVLLSFCLAVFSANLLFASEKVMSLGGKNGWQEFSLNDGITFGKGRFGLTSVELAKNERKPNENTDLLLNFENSMSDVVSNYTVVKNDLVQIEKSVMGKYCALSRGKGSGIELIGKIKSVIPNCKLQKCKFLLGVCRLLFENTSERYVTKISGIYKIRLNAYQVDMLDKTLKYVADESHVNEYNEDLNGLSYESLIRRFKTIKITAKISFKHCHYRSSMYNRRLRR